MAWEDTDVHRSIRRYLGLTLLEPWSLRTERREVRDEDRPVAVVELGPQSTLRAREALTQGEVESLYPVTISAYPPLPDEDSTTPPDAIREAALVAAQVRTRLWRWLIFGMTVTTEPEPGVRRHWAGPLRIPLWDYEGVPVTGPDRGGPDDPHDVIWVMRESVAVNAVQDPEDLRRWSVVANFRASVEQPGREREPDEVRVVTEGLKGHYHPPPG